MTKTSDGGQAFPRSYAPGGCGIEGMTLRDWFAGQAITGLLAGMDKTKGVDLSVVIHEAFRVAEGMIERGNASNKRVF